jgi:hypothetical protein
MLLLDSLIFLSISYRKNFTLLLKDWLRLLFWD